MIHIHQLLHILQGLQKETICPTCAHVVNERNIKILSYVQNRVKMSVRCDACDANHVMAADITTKKAGTQSTPARSIPKKLSPDVAKTILHEFRAFTGSDIGELLDSHQESV